MKNVSAASLCCVFMFVFMANLNAQNPGPNVIVGDLNGVSNYAIDGATNIDAFAVGTTSCNIGDANLDWVSGTNEHPVIGQTAFRMKDGRFEQIGQSWLKHGFFALSQALCDSCPTGSDGTYLAIGCSDPYGSGLNGSQSGLGPKFEVNAFTGVYPYPFTGQGMTGNSIYKRLQVHAADLDPALNAGALYFVEGQYVTEDESTAGNGADSVSWRKVQISENSGDYNMGLIAGEPTIRQEAAIHAWAANDASVNVIPVDVPGEGRFWAAIRSAPKPGGGFTFDVSIQNINSDRSCNGFEIAFPAGATITNVEFHDVDYHSGEPFDGTDWTSSVDNLLNIVSWDGVSHATNSDANAIRWGNMFSFHFESDLPTTMALNAKIKLFKPGTPTDVTFQLAPKGAITPIAGNFQGGNISENFANELEVVVLDGFGTPMVNEAVFFTIESGGAHLPGSPGVLTDSNGIARHVVRGANTPGESTIRATVFSTGNSVDMTVYTRRFRTFWTPANGNLLFFMETERPNMFLTLAFDAPQTPQGTPWGTIHTSILNPGFDFGAVSSTGLIGQYDASLVSDAQGNLIKNYGGNQALAGAGFTAVFQMYGYYIDQLGAGNYYISNPNFIFF